MLQKSGMFWQRGTLGLTQNFELTKLVLLIHLSEDTTVYVSLLYDRLDLIYMYFLMPKPEVVEIIKKVLTVGFFLLLTHLQ